MVRKKSEEHISLKFIFFLLAVFSVILFYISEPNDMKKLNKTKTFEEMLEYSNADSYIHKTEEKNEEKVKTQQIPHKKIEYTTPIKHQYIPEAQESIVIQKSETDYKLLLDSLTEYPAKSTNSVRNIVNKLLEYKGYPQNCLRVIPSDIDQSKAKTQGNYMVANFDFNTGNLYISNQMLYELNNKVLIAILAHELDHFDKLAKTCKYMGVTQFEQLFNDNNIKFIDTSFWEKASSYANIKDFKGEYYKDALTRFITQNNLELTSSYSDFYRLSENMRNPLEISAYAESDYVYKHFNIQIQDGPMKKLTQKFNDVDWAIYNTISQNSLISNERIAIFDYFFMQAILTNFPDFKQQFEICQVQKNGDLTTFWLAFENSVKSFYQKGKMDNETYAKMFSLLTTTESKVKKGITTKEISTALKYKINTLSSNLVYPNAIKNLEKTTINYLKYIKEQNINDPEQELKCILNLINIENELYTTNKEKEIALYYIKMPESLISIYDITNKKQRFLFIYNNAAFKAQKKQMQTEQALLTELLNKYRLDVRINN